MKLLSLMVLIASIAFISGCVQNPRGTQFVVLGESFASGSEAVREANNHIANAEANGCDAVSVGGYATVGETLIIGVPVLLDCPVGTRLLPDGTLAP